MTTSIHPYLSVYIYQEAKSQLLQVCSFLGGREGGRERETDCQTALNHLGPINGMK